MCDSLLVWQGVLKALCLLERRGVGGGLSALGVSHQLELPKLLLTTPLSVRTPLSVSGSSVFKTPMSRSKELG